VGSSSRNDYHIAFAQVVSLSPLDTGSKPLAISSGFPADHGSPGHQFCFTIDDVKDVCLFVVNFHLAGFDTPGSGDSIIVARSDGPTLTKRRRNGVMIDPGGFMGTAGGKSQHEG